MAESSMGMSQADIGALKEALCAQQHLLQKLYNELDVEREASATAASETLSMIFRLQGEKAAVKLEAEQYKRLAEEKMCHAEESLTIFEDLIYQKEMEIAALDYQVQAYRYKLLSMGCSDPGVGEIKFPENLLQRNENLAGEMSVQNISRRSSAPTIPLKYSYQKKSVIERERSISPETDFVEKKAEEQTGQEINGQTLDLEKKPENSAVGDINSYWEQIRNLDERVKEIAGVNYANSENGSRSSSICSQVSIGMAYDATKEVIRSELDQAKHAHYVKETNSDSACSSSIHDVFEVPQIHENHRGCGCQTKEWCEEVLEGDKRIEKPDIVTQEASKSCVKDETDWVKKMLLSLHRDDCIGRPSDGVAVDCRLAVVGHTIGVSQSQAQIQQLNSTSEIIELESEAIRHETINRKEEEMKLLNEIREQLNSIQSEIRSWKTKKSSPTDELHLVNLKEAMLHFWL
ncbi:unnamed protein product [Ilex paraguariensis]|uniref:GTD-binding domain-containing protein n=1 Tax=Ilex paraguariensis TaxID=185542 RepID=A0ABC8TM33_9AQUA